MLWMILGEDRPGAAELRAQTRPAHLNHIAPLAEAGRVRFAGPLLGEGESDGQACGSLIVAEFADRAGAQAWAADHGIALVFPDTSPRGKGVADDDDFALGQGAGFYVDATEKPWAPHFRMWDYIANDLPALLFNNFALDEDAQGITGHSMGGHGALTLAMAHPGRFRSVSAFAPIANPTETDWGQVQLEAYLGPDRSTWARHDATLQMVEAGFDGPILIDQGSDDQFLNNLRPEALSQAMAARRQDGVFRMQKGYDHSYFFVSTFMPDHVAFHADALLE